jgi:phosphorylcholine metabolism protein LicD
MGQTISGLELRNSKTHTLSHNMYSINLVKKALFFCINLDIIYFEKNASEMFTQPNDPINTIRNYVPKASFNITISFPKRHFFRFCTEFLTLL